MNDTQRTDAQQKASEDAFDVAGLVPAPFARELERELAAAQVQITGANGRADRNWFKVLQLEERIAALEDALRPFATEFEIADAAGELQHWPENEVKNCRAAWEALK